jgi:hypothetical protein
MDIRANNGSSFHLRISGYQFPEIKDGGLDANWLRIYMTVSVPQGSWSVTDPFLTTDEIEALADWLDAVAAHPQTENQIGFIEPNLSFEVIQPTEGTSCLRISFAIECLPPWADRSAYEANDEYVDFSLSDIELHSAAESLRSQLKLYPQRPAH